MTRQQVFLIAGAGSALLLGAAFFWQMQGYAPCRMCLWQRWPHAVAIVIAALALFLGWRLLALAGAAAALTTAGIGVYHTGVEQGWWQGPPCTGSLDLDAGFSATDLLDTSGAQIVNCGDVTWIWLGLSMASWNALASAGLALVWLFALTRPTRRPA